MMRKYGIAAGIALFAVGAPIHAAAISEATRIEMHAVDLAQHEHRAEADPLFRSAVRLDLDRLGAEHPGTAIDYSAFAANLSAEGRHAEAELLSAKAIAILRERRATALQGADGPTTALTQAKAQLAPADPLRPVFDTYLGIAWQLARQGHDDEALRSRAFTAAQEIAGSASAQAMAMAAARTAATSGDLAATLREQQVLTTQVVALDRRLLQLSDAPARSSRAVTVATKADLHRDMTRLAAINAHIDHAFPAYRAIISPQPLDIAAARSALAPDEGLLFLVASGGDIHSFAIGPRGSAWNRADGAATRTAATIVRLYCQVDPVTCRKHPGFDPPTPHEKDGYRRYDLAGAYDLYASLVAPVEAPLAHARTLYVVTSGIVGDLPLAMLVTTPPAPGVDDAAPATLLAASWLGDAHAFIHLPAVAGLRLRTVRMRGGRDADLLDGYGDPALAAAGVAMPRGIVMRALKPGGPALANPASLRALPSLPGTRRELTSMAQSMGAATSTLHLQAQATETEVKHDPALTHAAIVVFATHGILPGELEGHQEPGLILTPPNIASVEDDGILTASEASQLSLKADWVILSACNTASSKGAAGPDNLSSLARGFLYAGAHALLASHWRVSDEATAVLTVEAVRIRKDNPGLSGARALQAAMREVRTGKREDGSPVAGWNDAWSHPAAWASFSYIADHDE